MAENASSDSLEVLEGSVEKLNLKTALLASSQNDASDLNDDNIDFWGEDDAINDVTHDGLGHSSVLNREWKRRHEQFHTMGYRDGIAAGKEASAQEGFNVGIKQSVGNGYNWGLVRGVSSAYASLPDCLKEKLAGTIEKRGRLQNLYQSSQMISTTDALKMFHESIQHSETRQEPSESNAPLSINRGEGSNCSQLDNLFKVLISLLHGSQEIEVKIEPGQETLG